MKSQLAFPNIEEDIIASSIRHESAMCETLIRELEQKRISWAAALARVAQIEKDLWHFCRSA